MTGDEAARRHPGHARPDHAPARRAVGAPRPSGAGRGAGPGRRAPGRGGAARGGRPREPAGRRARPGPGDGPAPGGRPRGPPGGGRLRGRLPADRRGRSRRGGAPRVHHATAPCPAAGRSRRASSRGRDDAGGSRTPGCRSSWPSTASSRPCVPVRRAGGGPGRPHAGRRRPVAFEPAALEVLRLLADRLSLVLGAGAGRPAKPERPGDDLDLEATAARVAREAARRSAPPSRHPAARSRSDPGVAALVGILVDTTAPALEGEPWRDVRAGGGPWIARTRPDPRPRGSSARRRGSWRRSSRRPDRRAAGGGGPRPLSTAALEPMLAAARAIRNARLHGETLAALAERRA
jgi:hypothetical protein